MKNFKDTMHALGANIQLTTREKEAMRGRLHEYILHTPARGTKAMETQTFSSISFLRVRFATALVLVALLFTSGIGVTFASFDALPGERLYAVKELRESFTAALIFDETEKAQYAIARVQERIDEYEELTAESTVSTEARILAVQNIQNDTQDAHIAIQDVAEHKSEAEAEALRTVFSLTLEVRAEALAVRGGDGSEEDEARVALFNTLSAIGDADTNTLALAQSERANSAVQESVSARVPVVAGGVGGGVTEVTTLTNTPQEDDGVVMMLHTKVLPKDASAPSATGVPIENHPIAITVLVKEIAKEKKMIEERVRSSKNKTEKEALKQTLEAVTESQERITRAIKAGDQVTAVEIARETLRRMYRAAQQLDMSIQLVPVETGLLDDPEGVVDTFVPNTVETTTSFEVDTSEIVPRVPVLSQ